MAGEKKSETGMVVTAALVQAKVGGRVMHFYRGDVLPEGTDKDSLDNLRSLGFLGSAGDAESDSK